MQVSVYARGVLASVFLRIAAGLPIRRHRPRAFE